MARCLNTRPGGGHENPANAVVCPRCDFLVQGAHIGGYEVLSFIGAGSYGHVYKVREPAPLGRIMALKVLRFDQFNEKALGNFFDEARRIADLQHPNILPVYNFGKLEDERPYLVMEYAPQTIYDLFRRDDGSRRVAYAEELVPYMRQAADALSFVHQNGLIHQDVKPGNLLIGRSGQLLLSDFGTTFYLGMQTHASLGEATGTAAYMPPEQWQGNPRRDSDQYALAVSCYELLSGRTPFVYRRVEEMWNAHFNELPSSPQQWNRRIPVEVAAVILRALAKDYRQRYPNILEFAQKYADAVQTAQQRYVCQVCKHQNRTGAQRCSACGAEQDNRHCPYCDEPLRFGQRCCTVCGRLTTPPGIMLNSPLSGVSARQGRYVIKHVLKHNESLEERMQKLLRPLAEREVIGYMNSLLNVLMALEREHPPLRHYDITPSNIIIERSRGRPILTGFQVSPPPSSVETMGNGSQHRTTRKLVISPYLPVQDKPYDQRTCIYSLAACMHYALTNYAPPHYPAFPPVRMLNPNVSVALETILSRALMEDNRERYQSYGEIQRDLKSLL